MGQLELDKLTKGASFALDTVVFIYFLERHPIHYSTVKKLFHRIEKAELSAVISSLVFAELLVPVYRANDIKRAQTLIHLLTNFPNLQVISLSSEISAKAAHLRAIYNLPTPDAIHAATALTVKTDGIITNDKDFLRLSKDMKVWLLSHID